MLNREENLNDALVALLDEQMSDYEKFFRMKAFMLGSNVWEMCEIPAPANALSKAGNYLAAAIPMWCMLYNINFMVKNNEKSLSEDEIQSMRQIAEQVIVSMRDEAAKEPTYHQLIPALEQVIDKCCKYVGVALKAEQLKQLIK